MPELIWDESLSVGVELMDEQHRVLFQCINDLLNAMESPGGARERGVVLGDVIAHLLDYTNFHFRAEEALMEKYQYPDLDVHKGEHKGFIDIVNKMSDAYASGDHYLSLSLLEFLVNWLKNHIMGTDRKYTPYIPEAGT